jgi:protein-S-isoprenylcysteine O-methyltransferase Ste14
MKRRLKINGVIMFFAGVIVIIFPAIFFRKASTGLSNEVTKVFGLAFILLGQLFRVSGRGYKAENSGKGKALITSGPYSLVRNPMYLGIFLIGLGVVLVLFKLWVVLAFLAIFIIRYLLLIFTEEKKLAILFPKDYQAYFKSVPQRILPSISDLLKREVSEYLPVKKLWVKKEIGSIVAVLIITLSAEAWVDISHGGPAAYFKETKGIFAVIILFIALAGYLIRRTNN